MCLAVKLYEIAINFICENIGKKEGKLKGKWGVGDIARSELLTGFEVAVENAMMPK